MTLKRTVPGILVILVTNAIVLIEMSLNRAEPLQTIRLTERELTVDRGQSQDNSGIGLKLVWNWGARFDRRRLQDLGFDPPIDRDHHRPLPKIVFAALEYEGRAWTEWMSEQAKQSPRGTPDPDHVTRLIVVDAARTATELRAKYPDTTRYVIVRAVVRAFPGPNWSRNPSDWRGQVIEILPSEVHVPLNVAPAVVHPHYSVTLWYGLHFEPWIFTISPTAPTQ
jgi:hypothetical protein